MPPEQAAGTQAGTAADIYSLGAILYALLTGRPPHQAATQMDTLLAVMNQEPASLRVINKQIPRDLENDLPEVLEQGTQQALRHGKRVSG